MQRKVYLLLALALIYFGYKYKQDIFVARKITTQALQAHVNYLSSDALEGRLTGTNGEKLATEYAAEIFQQAGLEPAGDNGTYFQEFEFAAGVSSKTNHRIEIRHGRNVLARLRLSHAAWPIVVVGAHVDHLGRGELNGSRARGSEIKHIHAGADDNASGVASLLEAAITLGDMKKHGKLHGDKDILFALWSGEELGVLGSTYFVKKFTAHANSKSSRNISAEINLDMVGRLRTSLVLQGVASSSSWSDLIAKANEKQALPLVMQSDPYLPTDATPFYLNGVPALNLFTGSHDEYHTPRDQPATLNYAGLQKITNFLVDILLALEKQPDTMTYVYLKKTGGDTGRGFKVYLGTIPDYGSTDVSGVKLSGVSKDSPAELAGLRQNDVIVELAGKKIHDIYDYSRVLSLLHAGVSVPLVVQRQQARLMLKITAISREQL